MDDEMMTPSAPGASAAASQRSEERPHDDVFIMLGQSIWQLIATGKWWMVGKGQARQGEPMWACIIHEPKIDGKALVSVEGHTIVSCIDQALYELEELDEPRGLSAAEGASPAGVIIPDQEN